MIMQAFAFIFRVIGSLIGLPFNIKLLEGLTIGMFILIVFVICFLINKLFGMARTEIADDMSDRREFKKKERDSKMGKHAAYKPKHGGGNK